MRFTQGAQAPKDMEAGAVLVRARHDQLPEPVGSHTRAPFDTGSDGQEVRGRGLSIGPWGLSACPARAGRRGAVGRGRSHFSMRGSAAVERLVHTQEVA